MARQAQLKQLVERFGGLRIGVLGDVLADLYVTGTTDRVSREAPIIIVRQTGEELIPGGAANVAINIAALGAQVQLVGLVGRDGLGERLRPALTRAKVGLEGLLAADGHQTVAKTRIMAGASHTAPQQVLRIDREPDGAPAVKIERAILAKIATIDRRTDGWILSDYGYRLITPAMRERFVQIAKVKPVLADSRYGILDYHDLTAIKPNEQEAFEGAGILRTNRETLIEAAAKLRRRTRAKVVMITLGNEGMLVYRNRSNYRQVPAVGTDEIVDLTGAGDTAGAALITALAAGADPISAAMIANCAASVVVMKQGCASCSREELTQTLERHLADE
jgi:rfaE bifunctional protein kinase chain/domain